jgi:hypothetical protein
MQYKCTVFLYIDTLASVKCLSAHTEGFSMFLFHNSQKLKIRQLQCQYFMNLRLEMLNLENIPNKEISGLDDEMMAFVTEQSMNRYVKELSDSFRQELRELEEADIPDIMNLSECFPELDADDVSALKTLENSSIPNSTQSQTHRHVKKIKDFLKSRQLSDSVETVPVHLLNDYLRLFYSSLKTKDGLYYSPASLVS